MEIAVGMGDRGDQDPFLGRGDPRAAAHPERELIQFADFDGC